MSVRRGPTASLASLRFAAPIRIGVTRFAGALLKKELASKVLDFFKIWRQRRQAGGTPQRLGRRPF